MRIWTCLPVHSPVLLNYYTTLPLLFLELTPLWYDIYLPCRDRAPFVFTSDMAYVINGGDKPSSRFHDFVDLCCQAYNLIRKHTHLFLNLLGLVRHPAPQTRSLLLPRPSIITRVKPLYYGTFSCSFSDGAGSSIRKENGESKTWHEEQGTALWISGLASLPCQSPKLLENWSFLFFRRGLK